MQTNSALCQRMRGHSRHRRGAGTALLHPPSGHSPLTRVGLTSRHSGTVARVLGVKLGANANAKALGGRN